MKPPVKKQKPIKVIKTKKPIKVAKIPKPKSQESEENGTPYFKDEL